MKVILTEKDLEVLFKDSNCVVVSDWDGFPATINKTDDNHFYYMVRWEEYDPCTKLMNITDMVDIILSDGVVLHTCDYQKLFNANFN